MLALTLYQPFASLLVWTPPGGDAPAKTAETRSWHAPAWAIGRDIAIHAGKRRPRGHEIAELDFDGKGMPSPPGVYGAVVGIGKSLDVWRVVDIRETHDDGAIAEVIMENVHRRDVRVVSRADHFGDWSPGRAIWTFESVFSMIDRPVSVNGRQGLWTWRPSGQAAE